MALAPFPPRSRSYSSTRALAYSPSPRLPFLRRSSGVVRFRTRCSQHSVQSEAQPTRVPFDAGSKKRKPKPSFFEQIRGKWTSRTDSTRERFPWQVEEREPVRGRCEDERLASQEVPDTAVEESPEHERNVDSPVTDGVVRAVSVNQSKLPPWVVHGIKPSAEPVCDDESEAPRLVSEGEEIDEVGERLDDGEVGAGESVSECDFGGKFDTELDEWQELSAAARQGGNSSLALEGLRASDVFSDDEDHQENVEFEKLDVSGESGNKGSVDLPWKKEGDGRGKQRNVDLAERVIPQHELRRLRKIALRMVERMKVGDAGITQALVDSIHEKWREEEVVKLKFEGAPSLNMKRTHETLEVSAGLFFFAYGLARK